MTRPPHGRARAAPDDLTFCVVTCVKNEGPYLLEWIAHNRRIGVTDFLIFSNDCDDGTTDILDRLDDLGLIRHLPNPYYLTTGMPHGTALRYAPTHREFKRSDYIIAIDVDEFITFAAPAETLTSFVHSMDSPDVISLSELLFGFGGVEDFVDAPVLGQFTHSSAIDPGKAQARRGVKSIMRNTDKIGRLTNHRPKIKPKYIDTIDWRDGAGRPVSPEFIAGQDRGFDCRGCYGRAVLNHFTLRSGEAMLAKFYRGDAVRHDRLDRDYFRKRNHNQTTRTEHLRDAELVRPEIETLLQDDLLAAAHAATVAKTRARIEALKADPEMAPIWADIRSVVADHAPVAANAPALVSTTTTLPPIASLWIGGALSWLEQLCLKSFADAGHPTTLYSYGTIPNVPDGVATSDAEDIYPAEPMLRHARTGSPAIHADLWRLHLLRKTDAIWVDADMYCYRPFDFASPFVFGWEKEDLVCNAVLGLPKTSETLAALLEFLSDPYAIAPWLKPWQRTELEEEAASGNPVHLTEQSWGFTGPAAVTHFLKETGEIVHAQPIEAFYPISFRDRNHMIRRRFDIPARLTPATRGVHFWARRMKPRLEEKEGNVPMDGSFLKSLIDKHGIAPEAAPIPAKVQPQQPKDAALIAAIVSDINDKGHSIDRACRTHLVERSFVKECLEAASVQAEEEPHQREH